jgi:hypothetical protein
MTADELRAELKRLGVTPPEPLRASLYLQELQLTYNFFRDRTFAPAGYDKVKTAVQDPELLNGLAKALDSFVCMAVNADLNARGNPAHMASFAAYYDQFVLGDTYVTRRNAFYALYPVTDNLVQRIGINFRTNVRTACRRIIADWANIKKTFVAASDILTRLTRIKSSGSDFHKGGQQVLLLTFERAAYVMDSDDGHLQDFDLNLVYKPADLEADCLIAGNSAAVNAVRGGFQTQSLFELLNAAITQAKAQNQNLQLEQLPTYKILPVSFGSALQPNQNNLDIRSSYGYLEFLEHAHFQGTPSLFGYYPFGSSDFKIFKSDDRNQICGKFYRLIGQLTAIACTFSMIDLHVENIIVKNHIPYPIDMEISFTAPIENVTNTSLFGVLAGVTGTTGPDNPRYDQTGGQNNLGLMPTPHPEYQQNRLWLVDAAQPVNPADYAAALCKGFRDMLAVIRGANAQAKFNPWLARLDDTIVRYLPYGTENFAAILTSAANEINCADTTRLPRFVSIARGELYQAWHGDQASATLDPKFLALQDANVTADYQNGDIPIFYHRLNNGGAFGLNIMDSRGDLVTTPAQISYRNAPADDPIVADLALGGGRGTNFFAQSPLVSRVGAQLTYLTGNLAQRTQTLTGQMLESLGLAHAGGDVTAILQ